MRLYLGVGKYTPNLGVSGEMGWTPVPIRQWKVVANYWARLSTTNSSRLNKRIALWASTKSERFKNWFFFVRKHLSHCNLRHHYDVSRPISKGVLVKDIEQFMLNEYKVDWLHRINSSNGVSGTCRGRNKLTSYCTFKQNFGVEKYCKFIIPKSHRSALCKFRCGVAPIRLETGRYEGLPADRRFCPFCRDNTIENECHVLLECSMYNDIRYNLVGKAVVSTPNFMNMSNSDKLKSLFINEGLTRILAKTCFLILQRRQFYIC